MRLMAAIGVAPIRAPSSLIVANQMCLPMSITLAATGTG
jgi:hypothetical protein